MSSRRALALAALVGALVLAWSERHFQLVPRDTADVDQVIVSARALLDGRDAYSVTGPGREFDYPFPQFYPATAFVVLLPIARLSLHLGRALFVSLSAAWLVFAVLRTGPFRWPMLASGAFLWAVFFGQWTPALVAATLTPALAGVLYAAKPSTGLALLASARSWRAVWLAAAGGLVLTAVAFALQPDWPLRWLESFRHTTHFVAPVTRLPFGPLVLLALLRWRRPEARLLVALACVPQTNTISDVLPLFLVAESLGEAAVLAAATHVVAALQVSRLIGVPQALATAQSASWLAAIVYLPCVVMVLRRPYVPAAPAPQDVAEDAGHRAG